MDFKAFNVQSEDRDVGGTNGGRDVHQDPREKNKRRGEEEGNKDGGTMKQMETLLSLRLPAETTVSLRSDPRNKRQNFLLKSRLDLTSF